VPAAGLAIAPQASAAEKTPEAIGLDGRRFFPPDLPAEAQKRLEDNYAQAKAAYDKDPNNADNIIWLGRRLAYLSRYREAIDVFTQGIAKFPNDPRMYRHRGHRYITTRAFDKAVVDLEKAAALAQGRPDEGEPDGAPGKRPSPSSTLKFNIHYHLGLAHYLQGRFDRAEAAYRECMKYSTSNDDSLVATSDWLYMTLRRLGRTAEAEQVLVPIKEGMNVLDNDAYYKRLLMYKGLQKSEQVMSPTETDPTQIATQGYGVANYLWVTGEREKARAVLQKVVAGAQWAAFGFIAAEADLARLKTQP
jgi:tetratricopeptide (TPR) repeat protein